MGPMLSTTANDASKADSSNEESTKDLTIESTVPLINGTNIPLRRPRLGFGVYESPPSVCKESCKVALAAGYGQIDTAQYYGNEAQVGQAVRESGLPRHKVFVTTKILKPSGSIDATLERCRQSVAEIGLGYVDLFLIHTPSSGMAGRCEMWKALERLMEEGGTRAIGVSNYGEKHIEEMKGYSTVLPASNQIELHPWCQQRPIVEYCKSHGIILEAYSPLVRGRVLGNPTLQAIANAHNATPAQVLIRWSLQNDFIPLPKSDNPTRIRENADVYGFHLDQQQMALLDAMDRGKEGAIVPQKTDCP